MSDKILVDTNILVYAYDLDAGDKRAKARLVMERLWHDRTGVLNTQVLAEFFITVTRKVRQPLSIDAARRILEDYKAGWRLLETTPETVLRAIDGLQHYHLSFWDAMIWASARLNGIARIYTEDMQHGQAIEGVQIENPLLSTSLP